MVLVFYKKHAFLVPCIAEEELLIKFPFLLLEIIDGGRYSGEELELLRHFCLQGYIAHRTLCGLMATAGHPSQLSLQKS